MPSRVGTDRSTDEAETSMRARQRAAGPGLPRRLHELQCRPTLHRTSRQLHPNLLHRLPGLQWQLREQEAVTIIVIIALLIALILLSIEQEDSVVDGWHTANLQRPAERVTSTKAADEGETLAEPSEPIGTSGRARAAA